MSDTPGENTDRPDGSRMMLEPDALHETDEGVFLDCPQCGANVSITRVITEGTCTGEYDNQSAETEDDTELQGGCNANLSLELVWEA